jgi:hypothetical protein
VIFRLTVAISAAIVGSVAQTNFNTEQTVLLFGRVVNATTHRPVRRAVIKIYNAKDQWDEFTDGDGRFKFPSLTRGEYGLIAHRDGFTDRAYKVEYSDFDDPKELPIELFPQGMIHGRVLDGFGQPLEGAQIQALPTQSRPGRAQAGGSANTNDLGEYRISGLEPGNYRIRATYRDGGGSEFDPTPLSMATSIYGGSDKPIEISVKAGSEISGIDFVLNPVQPATIRGTLRTETGSPVNRAALWIMGRDGEGGHNGNAEKGTFEIQDVGPGSYTISGEALDEVAPMFGTVRVEVRDKDVNNVELVMRPSTKIEGRIQLSQDDTAILKALAVYFLRSDQVGPLGMKLAHPNSDGTFEVVLNPGEYTLTFAPLPDQFSVQKVTLDDKDVTDWKLAIESAVEPKKLLVVLSSKPQP